MIRAQHFAHAVALMCLLLLPTSLHAAGGRPRFTFKKTPGRVAVLLADERLAEYVYADPEIPRPYFAHIHAPGRVRVTRNHPPVPGKDPTDHADYHPGIWMAFGDLGGSDYWRNRAVVVHDGFEQEPTANGVTGAFAVRNLYLAHEDKNRVVCKELCRFTFHVQPVGWLLIWDSTFSAEGSEFLFGDQEEMGLGVRVATPISVDAGGTILDSTGRTNEREVWGNAADWCDYGGTLDGRHAGVTLMADPANFRPSWFHARDYGLLVANPFGRKAFGKGQRSQVVVKPGEPFRLRYGVLVYAMPKGSEPDLDKAYAEYVRLLEKQ